jgi:hypothetical protein
MSGFPNQPQFPEVNFPPPTPVKKRSNTTLYVVAGCLGLLLVVGILGIVGAGLLGVGVYQGVRSVADSEAYRIAKDHVASSAAARAELGDNIEFGSYPSGFNVSTENGQSKASLDFSATGSKGAGTVHVELVGAGDSWKIQKATLRGPSGKETGL